MGQIDIIYGEKESVMSYKKGATGESDSWNLHFLFVKLLLQPVLALRKAGYNKA